MATPPSVTLVDPPFDDVARPTDPGGDGVLDPAEHHLIDMRELTLGNWEPVDPASDLFDGSFTVTGQFLRLDLVVGGLVNPPGTVAPDVFDPFEFGDHPIFGFIEIDMDRDHNTGGEIEAPQYRYLGNIVRFGGLPSDAVFTERVAVDASAFDDVFATKPFVERHGEDFHLALRGGSFGLSDVSELEGNGDSAFDRGETWIICAPWFHRAHGYRDFSFAYEYVPDSELQFRHDEADNTTIVSLVFPLTNAAAGLMLGEPPEENDQDATNQASVLEGLVDLVDSAGILGGTDEELIIIDWKDKDPGGFLEPPEWRVTVLLGTSYKSPNLEGEFYVWTDAYPNVVRGDVNGENGSSLDDKQQIISYTAEHDEEDGTADDTVTISDFPVNFSVFDVNHDGKVDAIDILLVAEPGDHDDDDDVDLADFAGFQNFFTGDVGACSTSQCALADLDADSTVCLKDFAWFQNVLTGPEVH